MAAVRFKQWQKALRDMKVMRDELVRLGCTDPKILGGVIFTLPAPAETERQRWFWENAVSGARIDTPANRNAETGEAN